MTLSSELTSVHEGLLPRADAAQGCVIHPTLTRHVASQLHIIVLYGGEGSCVNSGVC